MNLQRIHISCSVIVTIFCWLVACTKDAVQQEDVTKVPIANIVKKNDSTFISLEKLSIVYTQSNPCFPNQEIVTMAVSAPELNAKSTCKWYFGDGQMATGTNVSHAYNASGKYVVKFTMTDSLNKVIYATTFPIEAWGQQIRIVPSVSIKYDFYENLRYVTLNATASINKGSIVKYVWDFGDNTTEISAVSITRHLFPVNTKDIDYPVKLTLFSDAGCSVDTTVYVWVPATYPITGAFKADVFNACTNETFLFTAEATNVPTGAEYRWDFSDGLGIKKGNPVTYKFKYMNDYDVRMSVYLNDRLIYIVNKTINVKGENPAPHASFYETLVSESPNKVVWSFNSQSTIPHGGIDGYHWDFGNGTTNSEYYSFIENEYTRAKTDKNYTVRLIVTGNGCADTAYKTVVVGKQ